MKKLIRKTILPLLALVSVLLTGCGADSDSPAVKTPDTHNEVQDTPPTDSPAAPDYMVIEVADTSNVTLTTVENDEVRFTYPEDDWSLFPLNDTYLSVKYNETLGTDNQVSITVSLASPVKFTRDLTERDVEDVMGLAESEYGDVVRMEVAELRLLNDEPVIYVEESNYLTDEIIDYMIEFGRISEEDIEKAGGREVLTSKPTITQITIMVVSDQYLFACTGNYYDETQKQIVLDTMTIIASTLERP